LILVQIEEELEEPENEPYNEILLEAFLVLILQTFILILKERLQTLSSSIKRERSSELIATVRVLQSFAVLDVFHPRLPRDLQATFRKS
jgi:hypothetical protein